MLIHIITQMRAQDIKDILSCEGQKAIAEAELLQPNEESFLQFFTKLCKTYPSNLAKIALEVVILRNKAQVKQKAPYANSLYYTKDALEQSSHYLVSQYRAKRFQDSSLILDCACSIGCDTITLSTYAPVIGIDKDFKRLTLAKTNISIAKQTYPTNFVLADLNQPLPIKHKNANIFFDPSRRVDGKRIHHVQQYQPPLSIIEHWFSDCKGLGVKLSPAVQYNEINQYLTKGAEIEFISIENELKEAVLWFKEFASCTKRATILPQGISLVEEKTSPLITSPPLAYIYEPNPAIIRAGIIAQIGAKFNAYQIDNSIAYLTHTHEINSPLMRKWKIIDWMPFQLKRIRHYLREHNIGSITVKKRGSPLIPEEFIHSMKLKGSNRCVLFLTKHKNKPIVIFALPNEEEKVL